MATKADFTEEEWDALRKGATGAGLLVSVSDPGFFDTFKEASSLAKHLSGARTTAGSDLIRELAQERPSTPGFSAKPQEVEAKTLEELRAAAAALRAKAPDELDGYRSFVLELAGAVAQAAKGGDQQEAAATQKIEAALSGS
jgi:hypothetical protein